MAETLNVVEMLPNRYEPKRAFRFVLQIEGIDAFLVKEASRPKMKGESVPIPWINHTRYVGGKWTFEEMTIKLGDPIAPSGAQQVMEWVRLHYESVSGRAGYADFYKRDLQLKMLDPIGTVIELWDIKGAMLTSVDFGPLKYEGNELADVTLTIQVDNCVLQY